MTPLESPSSVSVSRRGLARSGSDRLRTVVWVRGDHDIATRVHLSVTIAQAARLDDADIIVDLSCVTFMDASTIGALVVARNRLRARSRALSVRDPSPRARRLLDLCGLTGLIDASPAPQRPPTAPALASWVDVPTGDREPDADQACPVDEPVRVTTRPAGELAASIDRSRSPS